MQPTPEQAERIIAQCKKAQAQGFGVLFIRSKRTALFGGYAHIMAARDQPTATFTIQMFVSEPHATQIESQINP